MIDYKLICGLLASILSIFTFYPYVLNTIKGNIKPWEEGLSMWTIQVCSAALSILAIEFYNYLTLSKTGIIFL